MPVTYAGYQCIDPAALLRDCEDHVPPLPTDAWLGKANSFRCPTGEGYSSATILLRKRDIDAILATSPVPQPDYTSPNYLTYQRNFNTLLFIDDTGRQAGMTRMAILSMVCTTPGYENDPNAAYVVELADPRYFIWSRNHVDDDTIPVFNGRYPDGVAITYPEVVSTWTDIAEGLWSAVFGATVGPMGDYVAFPTLPFTPQGTPGHFDYRLETSVWKSLHHFLTRLACRLVWNPVTNGYTIARIGATDTAAVSRVNAAQNELVWSDYSTVPVPATPMYVQVWFTHLPTQFMRRFDVYTITDAEPYRKQISSGASANIMDLGQFFLWDDLMAYRNTRTATTFAYENQTNLNNRAQERYDDFVRCYTMVPTTNVYYGAHAELAACLGSQWDEFAIYDRGDGVKTELIRRTWWQPLVDWRPAVHWDHHLMAWQSERSADITINAVLGTTTATATNPIQAPIVGLINSLAVAYRVRAYGAIDVEVAADATFATTCVVWWRVYFQDPTLNQRRIVYADWDKVVVAAGGTDSFRFRPVCEFLSTDVAGALVSITSDGSTLNYPMQYYTEFSIVLSGGGTPRATGTIIGVSHTYAAAVKEIGIANRLHAEVVSIRGDGDPIAVVT